MEQPLLPYESCNLGSVNLAVMAKEQDGIAEIDYDKLKTTVKNAVHFLDNVIEVNKYPIKKIDDTTKSLRKIGLGVMGFSDLLYRLGIPYNSDGAISLAEEIMCVVREAGRESSIGLAKIRGTFPAYEKSIYKELNMPLRNATITTIAPTGTLSMIAGVSSGVEPVFALSYIRNIMDNEEFIEVNSIFENAAKEGGFYSKELMKKIAQVGHIHDIDEIPDEVKKVFVTAHEISPEWHIRMQSAFQKHTDNAVSKTVNFNNEATEKEIAEVFKLAYTTDCKGVTIYRDGSRDFQVLNINKVKGKEEKKAEDEKVNVLENNEVRCGGGGGVAQSKTAPRPRPEITTGFTEKVGIGCGNLYITVNYDESGICEVFTNTGKAGGCPSQSEATSRLVSIALRSGIDTKAIIEQLRGIRCPSTIRHKDLKVTSCPDAIARVIEKVMKLQNGNGGYKDVQVTDEEREKINAVSGISENKKNDSDKDNGYFGRTKFCPECGKAVEHEGGCVICRECGYSKCG